MKDETKEQVTFSNRLRHLRYVGWAEGASYLILLFIAMPLKYFAGQPEAVRVVGSFHGFAFIVYVIAVLRLMFCPQWSFADSVQAAVASLLPAGTFVMDRKWRQMPVADPPI